MYCEQHETETIPNSARARYIGQLLSRFCFVFRGATSAVRCSSSSGTRTPRSGTSRTRCVSITRSITPSSRAAEVQRCCVEISNVFNNFVLIFRRTTRRVTRTRRRTIRWSRRHREATAGRVRSWSRPTRSTCCLPPSTQQVSTHSNVKELF